MIGIKKGFAITFLFFLVCGGYAIKTTVKEDVTPLIDETRIETITIKCQHYDGSSYNKSNIKVLDTYKESLLNIVSELKSYHFPIYCISCYSSKDIDMKKNRSLHSYSAAIDINYPLNPSFDAVTGKIIPLINKKIFIDLKKKDTSYNIEYEDYFINRNVIRPGMVTEREAKIFAKHGFTIWGGKWTRPMDFMHFQTTKAIAKIIANLSSKEARIFWKRYLKDPVKIANDSYFSDDIDEKDIKLQHLLFKINHILKQTMRGKFKQRYVG
jgi:hypothetical protein